jgi:hypothetical protein
MFKSRLAGLAEHTFELVPVLYAVLRRGYEDHRRHIRSWP